VPIDETLPAERLADAGVAAPETWDRYEVGERLGEGGMGIVYKARDRRLDRIVAIKLIRGDNPTLAMRLVREARAQARIDHPGVCRVYEVGEVRGRAYIALQFVAGEPLGKAGAAMALDEKVTVFRDVCLAVHEAHRLGIVHRDLKPSNVLVERGEDGRAQPIVMDFGLARETTVDIGLTQTGMLMGTPAYMSPEQARGSIVDRRSDVYSLGATLYELIATRPPFAAESLAIALDLVINHDPAAPRSLVPALPVDLETITLKCLSKDPTLRYATARALADDLTRFLDGEPILGRRPSVARRLRTSFRKHSALYVLSASLTIAVLAVGAVSLRSYVVERSERARSVARAELAQRLGRDAKDVELLLHTAYQLPLHDTRRERELARMRMQAIAATRHDLGPLGDAAIHEALGRGHLALHEWQAARDELERATQDGLDTPELHAARGRALGELYHRELEVARRSGDKTWLAGRERELEAQYLAPALGELERGRGAADASALLDVLVPLYRRDYATAKTRALAIAESSPWVLESRKLAADAVYAAAVVDIDRGHYDEARAQLDEASTLYAQASDIARSDASVYEAAARAKQQHAEIDQRQGRTTKAPLDDALALIDRAITANTDVATEYTTKAFILLARARANVDPDRRGTLETAATAAERATALDPRDAGAWDALGNAHIARGLYEAYFGGGKGEAWWRKAVDDFQHGLRIRPNDPWTNNDLGTAHNWLGVELANSGADPLPEYDAALAGYGRATTIDPAYVFGWSNQVELSTMIAEYQLDHGGDPRGAIAEAVRTGEHGLAIDPEFDAFLEAMGGAEISGAQYLVETDGDPTAALGLARGYLDRADKLHPGNVTTWNRRARAARWEARWQLAHRDDPRTAIASAGAAIAEATRLATRVPYSVVVERAEVELLAGDLEAARADADKAFLLDGKPALSQVIAAEAELAIARRTHEAAAIARGLVYAEKALAIDPRLTRAITVRKALAALQ
jgi:serine/threonine-protein kinase